MKTRHRHRIYPNMSQRRMLARTFGCVRVVFNDALRLRQEEYQANGQTISSTELQKRLITQAKHTAERWWLADVTSIALQQSVSLTGESPCLQAGEDVNGTSRERLASFVRYSLS